MSHAQAWASEDLCRAKKPLIRRAPLLLRPGPVTGSACGFGARAMDPQDRQSASFDSRLVRRRPRAPALMHVAPPTKVGPAGGTRGQEPVLGGRGVLARFAPSQPARYDGPARPTLRQRLRRRRPGSRSPESPNCWKAAHSSPNGWFQGAWHTEAKYRSTSRSSVTLEQKTRSTNWSP